MRIVGRPARRLVLCAAVCLMGAGPLRAQTLGTLRGHVYDDKGSPVAGATVLVSSRALGTAGQGGVTDRSGAFQMPGLAPARDYALSAAFPGLSKVVVSEIEIEPGRTATLRVTLPRESLLGEHVEVRSRPLTIDPDTTTTQTRFSSEFIEALPILGRNYQDVLSLAPGVSDTDGDGNPNIHGARDTDVRTLVDSVSTVDPLTGKVGQQLNIESIDEIEIKTSGATAEFGRAQGGFINVITKSGGNLFGGTFKFFWRGSALDGDGAGHPEPLLHGGQSQLGIGDLNFNDYKPFLSLSGPIRRDRAWYFLTAEYIQEQEPVNAVSQTFITTTREKRVFGKLSWDLTPGQKIVLTATIDPFEHDNLGLDFFTFPESGYRMKEGGRNLVLKDVAIFNPATFLETTVQWFQSNPREVPSEDPDTNHNGVGYVDRNGDGVFSASERDPGEDWDSDGAWDVFEDLNHDGKQNSPEEDLDHDKRFRMSGVGCEGDTREDKDCDGHLDNVNEDVNHNHLLDTGEDLDGDLKLDDGTEDRNRNGRLDDRPFPQASDSIFEFRPDGTDIALPASYPYPHLKPIPPDREYRTNARRAFSQTSGPYYLESDSRLQRFTLRQDLSVFVPDWHGQHDIKIGGIVEGERYGQETQRRPILFVDSALGHPPTPPTVSVALGGDAFNNAGATTAGLYLQDLYKPWPSLTLALGLRFDREVLQSHGYTPFDPAAERRLYDRLYSLGGGVRGQNGVIFGIGDGFERPGFCGDPIFAGLYCETNPTRNPVIEQLGLLQQIARMRLTQHHFATAITAANVRGLLPDVVRVDPKTGEQTIDLAVLRDGAFATFQQPEEFTLTNNNLAPRLSLSWTPGAAGRSKVFANWGRYFDKLFLESVIGEEGPDAIFRSYYLDPSGVDEAGRPDSILGAIVSGAPPSATQVERNLSTPFADELTIGWEGEIAPQLALRFTYIGRNYRQQLQDRDINHTVRRNAKGELIDGIGTLRPQSTSTPDGLPDLYIHNFFFNQILRVGNNNEARYRALEVELLRRLSRHWQLEASYTYSRAVGAAETFKSALGDSLLTVHDEFGYLDYDQRHVVKLNAATYLPGDWQLGTVMQWSSGLPFSVTSAGATYDNAGYLQYATFYGTYNPLTKTFISNRRNSERNRAVLNIDVRAQKALVLGRMDSKVFLSVQNLLNRDDLTITGERTDTFDARAGGIIPDQVRRFGRRFEIGFQFDF